MFDEPFGSPAGSIWLTASVGIATTTEPVSDPEDYLSRADRAMYAAKRAGAHRVGTT